MHSVYLASLSFSHGFHLKGTWQWGGFSGVFAEIFEPFRFLLRIHGDIRIGKTTPCYHRYGESPTPRVSDKGSRRLPRKKENSLYRWYGESSTHRTSDTVSRWLPVSLSRGVDNSAYRWLFKGLKIIVSIGNLVNSPTHRYGESFFEYGYLCEFEAKIGMARNIV